jgi:head-tail adaptor
MSFGKMSTAIDIISTASMKDTEGFAIPSETVLASVRAYREGRHGTQVWANRAAFSEATDLFRFRKIPGIALTTGYKIICGDERFDITSVEDVKGRGMYVEVLAKKVEGTNG